ncbi:MAG TPA: hypothetical protein VGN72_01025 [Tepidisphaeraceae bacterium]|jgi:hypothetical protein|nr:hypothetical protein [Tepidisphaeraceae bacterium]
MSAHEQRTDPVQDARHPRVPSINNPNSCVYDVCLDDFAGGVGLWGAVPAGYDTTRLPMDRGIHVHARSTRGRIKQVDKTHSVVRLIGTRLPRDGIVVSELEAIYFMVSTVFGIAPQNLVCPACGSPHLDQDWYCVHPHLEHECEKCGTKFESTELAVGNPIVTVRELCGFPQQTIVRSNKQLDISQKQFGNGLLIWGSNPAFLWTGGHAEQEGMHVHVFGSSTEAPELDETFGTVQIDGVEVDAQLVRLHMAQQSLPSLRGKIAVVHCPECSIAQADSGSDAYTPSICRVCSTCGCRFNAEREVVSNPILTTFDRLAEFAQQEPQRYVLNLPIVRPAA